MHVLTAEGDWHVWEIVLRTCANMCRHMWACGASLVLLHDDGVAHVQAHAGRGGVGTKLCAAGGAHVQAQA
jgi:hypothetical protein